MEGTMTPVVDLPI
jgi:hypothetical protein